MHSRRRAWTYPRKIPNLESRAAMLKSMTRRSRHLAALAIVAAGILPAASAQAQSYSVRHAQPPYSYEVRTPMRDYPYFRCLDCDHRARLIERKHIVECEPLSRQRHAATEERRVIHADAEVIILGSDRINIRLFRKARDRGVVIHGDE
jgi:hypothetical protein